MASNGVHTKGRDDYDGHEAGQEEESDRKARPRRRRPGTSTNGAEPEEALSPGSCSDASVHEVEEKPQAPTYRDYDSCSDAGDLDQPPLLRQGRRTRQHLQQRVEGLVREMRQRQQVFKQRRRHLAESVNLQRAKLQEKLVRRSRQMVSKLQSGRSRAWRHKWAFVLVQSDFVVTSFWLGRSPETFYLYFTAQMSLILLSKAFDYRVTLQHYYLFDFCFYANWLTLAWIWLAPTSALLFNAADGFCGLLAISTIVFRNSCVPHDFVRSSHAYVHFPQTIFMLSLRLGCTGDMCVGMQAGLSKSWLRRFFDIYSMYILWAVAYAAIVFFILRHRIARKKRDTLFNYCSNTLGLLSQLPASVQPYPRMCFMVLHQVLFLLCMWWTFLPFAFQVIWALSAVVGFFHNGGRYYVDHFWKAYERNTCLYVDAAETAIREGTSDGADVPREASVDDVNDAAPGSPREQS